MKKINNALSTNKKILLAIVTALVLGVFGIRAGADNNWIGSAALSQVRVTIDQLTNKNKQLYDKYQQASQELANNQASVNGLNSQVNSLKQQLADKQTELDNKVISMSADKQREIDAKILEINQRIAEGNQKVADKQKEVDALNVKLQQVSANDEQLKKALDDANATKDYAQNALQNSK